MLSITIRRRVYFAVKNIIVESETLGVIVRRGIRSWRYVLIFENYP